MKEFLYTQFENSKLWLTFVMAAGAALYFTLPFEPHIPYPFIISLISISIVFFVKPRLSINAVLIFIFGFFYAAAFTKFINTPEIDKNKFNINLVGRVYNLDYTSDKARIYLEIPGDKINPKYKDEDKIAKVRVSLKSEITPPKIGDTIQTTISLFKPNSPFSPNSFDYSRWAYFNGLSATGYMINYETIEQNPDNASILNNLRHYLHQTANSFLVDTLILGYKNAVPRDEGAVWTATGVGHIWSISGFHIGIVFLWTFGIFYFIFRSIPLITQRFPARYPAMILSVLCLLGYLFLSGCDVATIRSFLMTFFIAVAFIFNRNVFNLYNVCLAFIFLFLINPHYIMQPGFGLSFSASFGLVWFFQNKKYNRKGFIKKAILFPKLLAITSAVAFFFTLPFTISHFSSFTIYSILGNLVLLPLFSISIMPLIFIGLVCSLFGNYLLLNWADSIYQFLLGIGTYIAELPYSNIQTPVITNFEICLMVFAYLCLMFIKNTDNNFMTRYANKLLFTFFILISLISVSISNLPVFYASSDNELIALRNENTGHLEFNKSKSGKHYFAFETWKKLNNQDIDTPNHRLKHNRGVYKIETKNWNLVYIQKFMPLQKNISELCRDKNIDYIVSYYPINSEFCKNKIISGGFVIYESGKIEYTNSNRLWQK